MKPSWKHLRGGWRRMAASRGTSENQANQSVEAGGNEAVSMRPDRIAARILALGVSPLVFILPVCGLQALLSSYGRADAGSHCIINLRGWNRKRGGG